MENTVLKNMLERSSVRDYLPEPIGADLMLALKQAALSAPTACDLQNTKFFFVSDPDILGIIEREVIKIARERGEFDYLERLAQRNNRVLFGAPLLIVIAVKADENYIDIDAGIAVQNIALAAKSVGLDSVIMAAPDRVFIGAGSKQFCSLLGFPDGWRFAISIAVGYAEKPKTPHTLNMENIKEL